MHLAKRPFIHRLRSRNTPLKDDLRISRDIKVISLTLDDLDGRPDQRADVTGLVHAVWHRYARSHDRSWRHANFLVKPS